MNRVITLQTPHGSLHSILDCPEDARGLVLLVRVQNATIDTALANTMAAHGYAIFGIELLTSQEARFADATQNVPRLTQRLIEFLDLIRQDGDMQDLPLAVFASGDTTPAAIRAAAQRDTQVAALACHGGIVDRAGLQALKLLTAPLLMLFDADDEFGPPAFQRAAIHLGCPNEMHCLAPGEDAVTIIAAWLTR